MSQDAYKQFVAGGGLCYKEISEMVNTCQSFAHLFWFSVTVSKAEIGPIFDYFSVSGVKCCAKTTKRNGKQKILKRTTINQATNKQT